MNEFILVAIKLLIGFFALTIIINVSGKGNLSPSSASDQVQNYVLGGIIGGVIYNNSIQILDYIRILRGHGARMGAQLLVSGRRGRRSSAMRPPSMALSR